MNLDWRPQHSLTAGLMSREQSEDWQILKSLILSERFSTPFKSYDRLSYYDLLAVVVDAEGEPLCQGQHPDDVPSCMVFTDGRLVHRILKAHTEKEILQHQFESLPMANIHLKTFMLGDLLEIFAQQTRPQSFKVNPVLWKEHHEELPVYLCEEVIFAPIFDETTKKHMMTPPENGRALLAINPNDQERFGIEAVFHVLNHTSLPERPENREEILYQELQKLAFQIPRVPIKRGSSSLYCVLLNLEETFEEMAFIRQYDCFDEYIDPIFVTSDLKLLTGALEPIPYDGERIDTIFTPLIQWQRQRHEQRRTH